MTVGWQTLLFFVCVNSCGIVACVLSHTVCWPVLAPFTKYHAACDLRCTACVFVYVRACACEFMMVVVGQHCRAGFPDLGKKQQRSNGLSPPPGCKRAAGYV